MDDTAGHLYKIVSPHGKLAEKSILAETNKVKLERQANSNNTYNEHVVLSHNFEKLHVPTKIKNLFDNVRKYCWIVRL